MNAPKFPTAREAIAWILEQELAGRWYRWDLGYNEVIQW